MNLEGPLSNCDSQLFSGTFDSALLTFASHNVEKVTVVEQFSKQGWMSFLQLENVKKQKKICRLKGAPKNTSV